MGQKGTSQARPHADGCKLCGRTDVNLRRGLCDAHYQRFVRKRKQFADVSEEQAEAFEARCIETGWIDPPHRRGRTPEVDAFEMLAREVEAEFEADIAAALAKEEARQAAEQAKKPTTARGKRKAN